MINFKNLAEKKILLVDDEVEILELLEAVLRKEGFQQIEKAHTAGQGLDKAHAWQPDLIVLDIMLPDLDGFEVCRRLREFTYAPILFLSARSEDIDKLLGLGIGGDDYITKPFSPKEVAFRIKAQFRRSEYLESSAPRQEQGGDFPSGKSPDELAPISFGEVTIDPNSAEVIRAGQPVSLTAREYQLLLYLARNPNRILSKARLCDEVWNEPYIGLDNTIMVHIHHLREKIEPDPGSPIYIQTVKGLGYKLVVEKTR